MDIKPIIDQLTAERDKLDAAIAALQGLSSTNGTTPAPAPAQPLQRRRRQQSATTKVAEAPKVVPVGKLVQLISDSDGQSTSGLARTTGGDQSKILELLKEAEQAGQVKRLGERRATRWHLVS